MKLQVREVLLLMILVQSVLKIIRALIKEDFA